MKGKSTKMCGGGGPGPYPHMQEMIMTCYMSSGYELGYCVSCHGSGIAVGCIQSLVLWMLYGCCGIVRLVPVAR